LHVGQNVIRQSIPSALEDRLSDATFEPKTRAIGGLSPSYERCANRNMAL
jgi:hypothetical protein